MKKLKYEIWTEYGVFARTVCSTCSTFTHGSQTFSFFHMNKTFFYHTKLLAKNIPLQVVSHYEIPNPGPPMIDADLAENEVG